MSDNNLLMAFDLSDQGVRAAIGQMQGEEIEVLALEEKSYRQSDCMEAGWVKKPSEVAYTLQQCVKLLRNRINSENKINSAFVSIGGKKMRTLRIVGVRENGGMLRITERLMKDLLAETIQKTENKYLAENNPIRIVEHYENRYWLDGQEVTELLNQKGKKIEVEYIFVIIPISFESDGENTIEKSGIKNIERAFAQAGLSIEQFFLKSDALSSALLENEEREQGCALIDFGSGSTNVSIYQNNKPLFIGCVPVGGKHITADISSLGISFENAEKLKCKYGQAMKSAVKRVYKIRIPAVDGGDPIDIQAPFLSHIIELRQRQILSAIVKQIKNHQVEHLIITGEGSKLHDLNSLLYEETGIQARVGSHDVWISGGIDNEPSYSLLVGTLLLGSCYRKEHPDAKPIKPIIPNNIKDKAKEFMNKLFN